MTLQRIWRGRQERQTTISLMKMRDVERKEKLYQMNLLMKVAQEKMKQEKLKILQQEMDQQWVKLKIKKKGKIKQNLRCQLFG